MNQTEARTLARAYSSPTHIVVATTEQAFRGEFNTEHRWDVAYLGAFYEDADDFRAACGIYPHDQGSR